MIQSLPGFREFYPADFAVKHFIFKNWEKSVQAYGFEGIEAPVLEPLELFTEKSGPEIVEQLFHFTDKGGRGVALRPELTPSVVRMVGAKAQGLRKPIRWYNIGEQFRFERPQKGRLRSFYQLNVDFFGVADESADAEVISTLIALFKVFGLTANDFKVRLSDRHLWFYFLEAYDFDHEEIKSILAVVDKWERLQPEVIEAQLKLVAGERTALLIQQIQFLIQARDLKALEKALGDAMNSEKVVKRLMNWSCLLSMLGDMGIADFIQIDLGIVRGLAYYTGFVFEVFEVKGQSRALAGGGRYDDLVEKMGGPVLPAVGFAIGDVVLTDLLKDKGLLPIYSNAPSFYILFTGVVEKQKALLDIQILRGAGIHVTYALGDVNFSKQMKLAGECGVKNLLIYGEDELKTNQVRYRDFVTRDESLVDRSEILNFVLNKISH